MGIQLARITSFAMFFLWIFLVSWATFLWLGAPLCSILSANRRSKVRVLFPRENVSHQTKEGQNQWTIQRRCYWDSNTTLSVNLLKDSSNGNSDKKKQSELFEGQHKQEWSDMCNWFDRQQPEKWWSGCWCIQNEINIHVYTCWFESLILTIYPNILRDIFPYPIETIKIEIGSVGDVEGSF